MNTCDALLTDTSAHSFVELSLSPCFARRWPSLYEGFDDAQVHREALQKLFVSAIPPQPGKRLVLAADASPIVRAESPTARDRTYVHVPNMPDGSKPVSPGWQFATVVAVPEDFSSWTTILSNERIPSDKTQSEAVAALMQQLSPLLPPEAIVLCDGGFGNPAFLSSVHALPQGKLVRVAKNRVFYRPAPERTGGRGAPRKDGTRMALSDPATHGAPDAQWSGTDGQGRAVEVSCWHRLHFKKCRQAEVSLLRVHRLAGEGSKRNPPTTWLIWQGTDMPDLSEISSLYKRRYSIEHSYRFDKQSLLWNEPRLRTPEKMQVWTDLVSAVHNEVTLARPLTQGLRQPWERNPGCASPQQVRRACGRIIAQLGTPAPPPKVRGKSPGRVRGAVVKKAERFPTVYKRTDNK